MAQIELLSTEPNWQELLYQVLAPFEQRTKHTVEITSMGWGAIWRELVNISIYRRGGDVAEVGSSWLDSLAAMNALAPFSAPDIAALGGQHAFVPAAWATITMPGSDQIWAIPFRSDVRVLYYWADLVEQAGLDPQTAFQTPERLDASFQQLQAVTPFPWAASTAPQDNDTLYNLASWVWAAGGEFSSPNGKSLTFNLPAARQGMRAYFSLLRFMPPDYLPLDKARVQDLFMQRKVAAVMSGPWIPTYLKAQGASPELAGRLGMTRPPGPAYVGGSALVVWQHSAHRQAAMDLVHALTTPQSQAAYVPSAGLMPVREEVWKKPPFSEDAFYRAVYQALKGGRTLPPIAFWGTAEEKLSTSLGQIWADYLAQPTRDLDELIGEHLDPLARRLNAALNP